MTETLRGYLRELEAPENLRLAYKASQAWAAGFSWQRMRAESVALAVDELQAARAARTTSATRSTTSTFHQQQHRLRGSPPCDASPAQP